MSDLFSFTSNYSNSDYATASLTSPDVTIYIYDYYTGTYDDVALTNVGSYSYGYDDQGETIFFGSDYYSPEYVYDAGEDSYFYYDSYWLDQGYYVYTDYTPPVTSPSTIYIYDANTGSYDDVALTDVGSYSYGYDDQGETIYFGSDYYSPEYVYDANEGSYFYYDSYWLDQGYYVYTDYTPVTSPDTIYIYDANTGSYDDVALTDVGSYSYGYDDQGDTIYFGSDYYSPEYVYDAGEGSYFYYDSYWLDQGYYVYADYI